MYITLCRLRLGYGGSHTPAAADDFGVSMHMPPVFICTVRAWVLQSASVASPTGAATQSSGTAQTTGNARAQGQAAGTASNGANTANSAANAEVGEPFARAQTPWKD